MWFPVGVENMANIDFEVWDHSSIEEDADGKQDLGGVLLLMCTKNLIRHANYFICAMVDADRG